jgi:hypothetical protein
MKSISRRILIGALGLIFLNSACGALTGATPTPVGTILPDAQVVEVTSTNVVPTAITPSIPITGENVVSMQCQFCVDTVPHAVLIFPEFAFFDVVTTEPVTCLTAQVVNGQRVLLCRGAELTTFTLNICSDPANCLQFPVTLETCPLIPNTGQTTPVTPFFLNPINTLEAPTSAPPGLPTGTSVPAATPTAPSITVTPSPATSTPEPPPTVAPTEPPTEDPPPADDTGPPEKKPTKTPKPKNTKKPKP